MVCVVHFNPAFPNNSFFGAREGLSYTHVYVYLDESGN